MPHIWRWLREEIVEENREKTKRQVTQVLKELRGRLSKENEETLRLLMADNKEEEYALLVKHKEQMKFLTKQNALS